MAATPGIAINSMPGILSRRASRERTKAISEPARERQAWWLCLGGVYAIGAALAAWSWRKWPDVYVDFGRELYVAWRISQGAVLYRDVASFNGALSPYVNGALFRWFGVSFTTLIVANLLLLALLIFMLFTLLHRCAGLFAATIACLVFVTVFAFSQYVETGNYNYVTPYSHELTHGVVLGVAAVVLFALWLRTRRDVWIALSGLAVGLTFLTKVEAFAGAITATAVGIGLAFVLGNKRRVGVVAFTIGLLLPPLAAVAMIGLDATLTPWRLLLSSSVASDPFYKKGMGLDVPAENLLLLLKWTAAVSALVGAALLVDRRLRTATRSWAAIICVVFALGTALGLLSLGEEFWFGGGRFLPVAAFAVATMAFIDSHRLRATPDAYHRSLVLGVFALYGFVLLTKMILFARVWHYGFALAMPATLVFIVALIDRVPARLRSLSGRAAVRGIGFGFALLLAFTSLELSRRWYQQKTLPIGRGGDTIMTYRGYRGDGTQYMLSRIEAIVPEAATVVVLPAGIMLNYLSRHLNPVPFTNFMPSEFALFGEEAILAALQHSPPDFVAIIPWDFGEWGRDHFGEPGYAERVAPWIQETYGPAEVTPRWAMPFQEAGFWLLQHR
jgi:hypothetical protein